MRHSLPLTKVQGHDREKEREMLNISSHRQNSAVSSHEVITQN